MRRAVRVRAALGAIAAAATTALLACSLVVDTSDLANGRDQGDAQGRGDDVRVVVDGAAVDAPVEARPGDAAVVFTCTPGPTHFCDDFDKGTQGASWTSTERERGNVTYGPVGLSPPNALHAAIIPGADNGSAYLIKTLPGNPTDVHCELDLDIEEVPAEGETDLVDIITKGTAGDSYHVYLARFGESWKIAEYQYAEDGGIIDRVDSLGVPLPRGTWFHVVLETKGRTATLTANGTTVSLGSLANVPGTSRSIAVGITYVNDSVKNAAVSVDNVDCTFTPL